MTYTKSWVHLQDEKKLKNRKIFKALMEKMQYFDPFFGSLVTSLVFMRLA